MAKGDIRRLSFVEFNDSETGTRIIRLTPPDVINFRNYFYQKCFSKDGRFLLFGSDFDGLRNNWLLDLYTGESRQLTEGRGSSPHGAFLSADERSIYYVKLNSELRKVSLNTLEEEIVYRVPERWRGAGTWVPNSLCTKFAAMEQFDEDVVKDCTGWEKFQKQFRSPPRSRLISINGITGEAHTVVEQRVFMGHPMYRPHDDDTMGYCHEGPHDLVDSRMWLVNSDGSDARQVKRHRLGEACMHEFWVPDGSKLIYVSYSKSDKNRYICSADPESLENNIIMPMPTCSHLMSNYDGTLLVGDGAGHLEDVADQKSFNFQADPFLYLFDIRSRSAHKICRHGSSWREYKGNHQISHPHPSFTPDNKQVLFTSDFEGLPAIYLADLPNLSR
jgi:oligogalacturonide lyase